MLAIEGSGAIFSADHLNYARTTRMLIDPLRQVVDLAIDSAPTARRFRMLRDICHGVLRTGRALG